MLLRISASTLLGTKSVVASSAIRHTKGFFNTMPPKRKRVGPEPTSTPTEAPRRSSRRNKKSTAVTDDAPVDMAAVDNTHSLERPSLPLDTKEGVERAMRDMGEMETKLKNASRKQRLAVENSNLTKQDSAFVYLAPPKPQMRPPEQKVLNQKPHVDRDAVDEAKLELEDECDIAMADKEEETTVDDEPGPERGARRPPPVNSDRLPLPWTGRLGYVSRILWNRYDPVSNAIGAHVLTWDRLV